MKYTSQSIETLQALNTAFALRNVKAVSILAAATSAVTGIEMTPDPEFEAYSASLGISGSRDGSVKASFVKAAVARSGYVSWIWRKLDQAIETGDSSDWLYSELVRLGVVALDEDEAAPRLDQGLTRWFTRSEVGAVEYGLVEEVEAAGQLLPDLVDWDGASPSASANAVAEWSADFASSDEGTALSEDMLASNTFWAEQAALGPALCSRETLSFESRDEAVAALANIKSAWAKGDHRREFLSAEKTEKGTFVLNLLVSDTNWDHRGSHGLALARERVVSRALRAVAKATSRDELVKLLDVAKRYSRDNQLLSQGETLRSRSGVKKVGTSFDLSTMWSGLKSFPTFAVDASAKVGLGLDYARYAEIVNAISARADALGFAGFKALRVDEFETVAKAPKDCDYLDSGAGVGEFVALGVADEQAASDEESLWQQLEDERASRVSSACWRRLIDASPTGRSKSWNEMLAESMTWHTSRIRRSA